MHWTLQSEEDGRSYTKVTTTHFNNSLFTFSFLILSPLDFQICGCYWIKQRNWIRDSEAVSFSWNQSGSYIKRWEERSWSIAKIQCLWFISSYTLSPPWCCWSCKCCFSRWFCQIQFWKTWHSGNLCKFYTLSLVLIYSRNFIPIFSFVSIACHCACLFMANLTMNLTQKI